MSLLEALPRNAWIAVGLPVVLGTSSGLITKTSVDSWYPQQRKPPGEPPKAAFPIMWTGLYAGMGYASHLIINALDRSPSILVRSHASTAIKLYWAQLALNVLWTPLFFGVHKTKAALVDILALSGVTYTLTYHAFQVDKRAGWVFVAYSAWLTYATYLNAGIVYLNEERGVSKAE